MLRAVVVVAACLAAAAIVASGFAESTYPLPGITLFVALVGFEATVLLIILRPKTYRDSWGRALAASGACLVGLFLSAHNTLGAPEYVFFHQKWLAAASVALVGLAIASLIKARRKRHAV